MGDILYGILFNITTLSMALVPFIGLVLAYKWTMFSMYERPYHVYPEDKGYYDKIVSDSDKPSLSVKEWKMDRFAYNVHIYARCIGCPSLNIEKTDLPFKEWLETIHPEMRKVWREYGNPTVSPNYPGAEVEVSNRVYVISNRLKI